MKRVILFSVLLLTAVVSSPAVSRATEVGTSRKFGLGVQLFEPTAIIGKLFLDRNDAVDFGVGFWGYGRCYDNNGYAYACNNDNQYFSIHADYLYEEGIVDSVVRLDWHAGAGGRIAFDSYVNDNGRHDAAFFARVPLGLDLAFKRPRWLETYLEIAPGLWIFPPLKFDIDVGLGVRAYF
ncbi:MAG TPA: DUF3996 domain-containing protein [Polyangia bacterium]|jgi:hypothetical protein